MIYGVGTDIAEVARFEAALARHGERFAERILDASELPRYRATTKPARYLAKRFAAKEAFAKALGTGVREPATLHAIRVANDALGKPVFTFGESLRAHLDSVGLTAHLSISDEAAYALAFVVIERTEIRNG